MDEIYENFFDYGPVIGQEVSVYYYIVGSGASRNNKLTGEITDLSESEITLDLGGNMEATLSETHSNLYVYENGEELGKVETISER